MKAWTSETELADELGSLIQEESLALKCEGLLIEADRRDAALKVIFDAADEAVEAYNNLKGTHGRED
ncbi:MAG: hypothetical protein BroJett025_02750 [Patescibacteria group bacterium]|nr:MAG: hypothetical protein BroJett025_02750 [Patescibacteria group bacterium]